MKNIYIKDSNTKIYYFRKRLYKDLVKYFTQTTFYIKTLQTKNKNVAVKRAKILDTKYMYLKRHYKTMTSQEIEKIVSELIDYNFNVAENDLYNCPNPENTLFNLTLDDTIEHLQQQLQENDFNYVQKEIATIIRKTSLSSDDLDIVQRQLMGKTIDALKTLRMNINDALYTKPRQTNKSVVKTPNSGYKLSKVIEEFVNHTSKSKNWSYDTIKTNQLATNTMMKYFSDTAIETITRKNILDFRDTLLRLPQNFTMKKIFIDKNLEEICEMAEDEDMILISDKSVNKYLNIISNVFDYCVLNDYIVKNPCIEVNLKVDKTSHRTVFENYEIDKLDKIMNAEDVENNVIYQIAKFSGCRLNEICQLRKQDVKYVDDVLCLDINRDDKKVTKNKTSIRLIPVHSKLEHILQEYIHSRAEDNLFTINNKYFSKYFRTKIKHQVTENKNKVFYSLRHNFANELIQKNVRSEHIASMMGHTQSNAMTMSVYGEKINVALLKEQIEKIYN